MNKTEFYQNINADTQITEDFCKKLYGYSMYDLNFRRNVIHKLKSLGHKDASAIFNEYLKQEQQTMREILKPIAKDMVKEMNQACESRVLGSRPTDAEMYTPVL